MENSECSREAYDLRSYLLEGHVIPAHPLALTPERRLDERRQRALSRYYLASGAGGLAVGVHTTQFQIHSPGVGLYQPVLELALDEILRVEEKAAKSIARIAGLVGETAQAVDEASLARTLGYDCGLLSLSAFQDSTDEKLLEHVRAVAEVLPLFGFYLQPAVGGRILSYRFWREFSEIENVVAIKIAPFNRYQTLDVVRAVWDSGRCEEIALYTGNDDNIIGDLLSEFSFSSGEDGRPVRIVGGLLGQWAVWTERSVKILIAIQAHRGKPIPTEFLRLNAQLTDANSAIFDAANQFHGCIAGIHEVLRRQGLLRGIWCLDSAESLSPAQIQEIDRVCKAYPHLSDDDFVKEHLDEWLK